MAVSRMDYPSNVTSDGEDISVMGGFCPEPEKQALILDRIPKDLGCAEPRGHA